MIILPIAEFSPPMAIPPVLTLTEGGTGREIIHCSSGNFRPVDAVWTFNGTVPRFAIRRYLILRNITQDDAGTYRCQLSFDGEEIEGAFADFGLTVHCECSRWYFNQPVIFY